MLLHIQNIQVRIFTRVGIVLKHISQYDSLGDRSVPVYNSVTIIAVLNIPGLPRRVGHTCTCWITTSYMVFFPILIYSMYYFHVSF